MSKRIAVWSIVFSVLIVPGMVSGQTLDLEFSTYLGGSADDYSHGITVDSFQCAYLTGRTVSADFPTVSAFSSESAGGWDAFVCKFGPTGLNLIYSTYLGYCRR